MIHLVPGSAERSPSDVTTCSDLCEVLGHRPVGRVRPRLVFRRVDSGARQIAQSNEYTPTVGRLRDLSQPTTVYDATGAPIGKLGVQDREPAELAEVPQVLINAVIATEDKTFWKNSGIDVSGVSRAFVENLTSGEISQGGSTITQQLVKNRILGNKQDLQRKAKELVLAYRLNNKYSKREILKQYLNTVYFGQGSYGVKATARRFFLTPDPSAPFGVRGKQLGELTVGESALMAGLIQNPEGDNPFVQPDRALERRADVLKGMVEERYITQAQADEAGKEPLPTVKPSAELRPDNAWTEKAQDVLLNDPRLGATPEQRRDKLLQGGLQVHTTVDPTMQRQADTAVSQGLRSAHIGLRRRARIDGSQDGLRQGDDRQPPVRRSQVQPRHRRRRAAGGIELQDHDAGDDPPERLLAQRSGRRHGAVRCAGLQRFDRQRRGWRWRHDHQPGDGRVGELRVRAPVHERGPRQGHRHGPGARHAAGRPRPSAGQRMAGPHLHARRHLGHAARDGEHDGDDRGRRRPPRPGLRLQGGGARRQGPLRRGRPSRHAACSTPTSPAAR